MSYVFVVFCTIIIYVFLRYRLKRTVWCRSQTCLLGKTAIVTGANTGIGFETALDFAKRGARVILACRNEEKAEDARLRIIQETGNKNVVVKIVNFGSFESVRNFAENINANESRVDILVNNAGAGGIGDKKSVNDNVLLMQINYFSHFLLTNLLINLLKKSAPSRVINVSSIAAKYAKFDLDDLNRYLGHFNTYANSKLCNIWFTIELAKKLEGSGVTAYSLHPGAVKTEIFRRLQGKIIFGIIKELFFKSSEEGAQTSIYLAVAKGIEEHNGGHFDNCQKVKTYKTVDKPLMPIKLWEKSMELVKSKEIQL